MMYAQKLTAPAPKADDSAGRRVAARKQIIRQVEDSIHRDAAAGEAESLHGELLERMEAPEFDDEIEDRPVADIVADIRADLGIGGPGSQERRKRRTPADIAIRCDRAAVRPAKRPNTPVDWAAPDALWNPVAAEAARWDDGRPIRGP